jgi:hypothetical protein
MKIQTCPINFDYVYFHLLYMKLIIFLFSRRMKLKKEIQAIKELNEQEKQAQAAKAAAVAAQCEQQDN